MQPRFANGAITTQNLNPASGVPTPGSFVQLPVTQDYDTLAFQVFGTYTGALSLQVTLDGTNWKTLGGSQAITDANTAVQSATVPSGAQSVYQADISGFQAVRLTALAAVTGTANVTLVGTPNNGITGIDTPLQLAGTLPPPATATTTSITKAEDAVHTSADSGIMALGVRYETNNASPVSAAGDYGFVQIDDLGKIVAMPYAPPVNQVQGITAAMTGTASTAVLASAGAGVRNYVTNLTLTNTHATVGTEIDILDGATVLDRIYVPALATISKSYNVPLKGTAATAVNAQNVTTGSNTYVQATGFKAI